MTELSWAGRLRRRVAGAPHPDRLLGRLDGTDGVELGGWASRAGRPASYVELRYGAAVVAEGVAGAPRPDVLASGQAPLACGFAFDVAALVAAMRDADAGQGPQPLSACVDGIELPGATQPLTPEDLVAASALASTLRSEVAA